MGVSQRDRLSNADVLKQENSPGVLAIPSQRRLHLTEAALHGNLAAGTRCTCLTQCCAAVAVLPQTPEDNIRSARAAYGRRTSLLLGGAHLSGDAGAFSQCEVIH